MASQTLMTRAGQQPALAVILTIAGVVGFGFGTLLGVATRPTSAVAVAEATPSITAPPSAAPSPSPTAAPTETPVPSQAPPQPHQVILTLEGDSHAVSDSFDVKPGWQIQWQIDGSSIAIAVTGDSHLGVLVDYPGPASGVRGIPEGGVFRLEIVATGPWKVTVIDGEEPAASAS